MYPRRGMVAIHFLPQSQLSGSTGKFIYKALILCDKQPLSNMIDCEPTQVSYIRITFLTDSYIFCSNFLAILCIIAIASYIAVWRQRFWTETQSSYSYFEYSYIDFCLSNRSFKYIIHKYLATIQVFSPYNNRNQY